MNNENPESLNGTELPEPQLKPDHQLPEHNLDQRPSTEVVGSKAAELSQVGGPDPVSQAAIPTNLPATPPAIVQSTSSTSGASVPVMADDNDLIEKEWVQRAKAIVEKTKDDPYQQNKQMTTYKADYLKKRFNKDIRVAEG